MQVDFWLEQILKSGQTYYKSAQRLLQIWVAIKNRKIYYKLGQLLEISAEQMLIRF